MSELLKSGTILQNTYRILRVIDQGGMGAIYMAENRQLFNEICAVKEMLDNFSSPEERKDGLLLFKQEAEMLNRLRHPNLPRVRAYFSENNRYYLVMDYIKGRTLESILESTSDFIPESVVMRWDDSLCNILEYLHAQNPPIIFRDLNPRNIMLEDGTGEIKLIDFGIARVFKAGKNADTISLGSPGYCPIEQYGRGQTDARSDVYTLGATLYHLLTKRVPVAAVDRIKPTPVLLTPPRQINRRISPGMEQVILKAMEINPDDRYQTVAEMRQALNGKQALPKTAPQKARTAGASAQTASSQTQTRARPQTPSPKTARRATGAAAPPKPRSSRIAWGVVLFISSMVIAQWVEEWQNRDSGRDANPGGARKLEVPGSAEERVSFMAGDRTDWWRLEMPEAGTLSVTVTPDNDADRIRLTIYDSTGRTVLKKGETREQQTATVVTLDRPAAVLAQVMALRLWDSARYTITAMTTAAPVVAALPGFQVDVDAPVDPTAAMETPETAAPDTAPALEPGAETETVLDPRAGQGMAWWRVDTPATGVLTVTAEPRSRDQALSFEVFDRNHNPVPVQDNTFNRRVIHVIGPAAYFIKVAANDGSKPVPYKIGAQFAEDPDAFSGDDHLPSGAQTLPYQGRVQDAVSYDTGDRTDWWRLEMPEAGGVTLELTPDTPQGVRTRVYEALAAQPFQEGREEAPLKDAIGHQRIPLDGKAGSVYYVAITAPLPHTASGYEIRTAFAPDPEAHSGPDAAASGANPMSVTEGARGTVDYARGDRTDWWRMVVPGPGRLTVALNGRNPSTNLQLELYDRDGVGLLAASKNPGSSREEVSTEVPDRTTYLLKVYAESEADAGAYQLTPWYEMSPDADSGRDAQPDGATALLPGKPSRSSVDYTGGDRTDWWKVRVPGPGMLSVDLEKDTFLANLDIQVYASAEDTPLASKETVRKSRERVDVEIETPGWYYVKITAHETGDASRYTLTATFQKQTEE